MPAFTRIQLTTTQPFHFGQRGVGLNETTVTLPADTLFSALCMALATLYGPTGLTRFLGRFPTATNPIIPPLRLSSLMPYWGAVDLLPMPKLQPRLTTLPLEKRKLFKRIAWVSSTVFRHLAAGEDLITIPGLLDQNYLPYTVQGGQVWVSKAEQTNMGGEVATLWQTDIRPRVTVDRVTGASAAFSSGGLYLNEGVGLYALLRWETAVDESLLAEVKAGFRTLGEQGIGGERAYGYGHFTTAFAAIDLPGWGAAAPYYTTLSPYLPQQSERGVLSGYARYAITLRRGWLSLPGYSNLRRPTVRMIETGAILSASEEKAPLGYLADATPEPMRNSGITIYRYGLAWPVPIAAQAIAKE